MAALLAGARLVLSQGARLLPAYARRPPALPARFLSSSVRLHTTAVQEKGTIDAEPGRFADHRRSQPDGWSLHDLGWNLKTSGRVSKLQLLKTFEEVCKSDNPSSGQAWLLLRACGSSLPEVPPPERTELANTIWKKLQELGVLFNESHYSILLKIYLENEHKFSPTEFLAGMEAAQVQPSQTIYQRLIAAYCSEGDIEGASKILGFMKSQNLPITEEVFNSLITGHARSGDMESAKNIPSIMQGAGLAPRRDTDLALLCAYAEKGDMEGVQQTLDSSGKNLTDKEFLKIIYSMAKAGHSQHVPEIFKHMNTCTGYTQDVKNLCLTLLTQGNGETALRIAKKFVPVKLPVIDFVSQPGSFFLHHCVSLNMTLNDLKKYAAELAECNLITSPLQFTLYCALELDKKDLAIELMRTLKEEGLPVRPHYCWPLLASYYNEHNRKGVFQVLKTMQELDVELDLDTFAYYVVKLFEDAEAAEADLQELGFQKDFNRLYHSTLKRTCFTGNFKRVYSLLSTSNIPLVKENRFMHAIAAAFVRSTDAEIIAKITKLLYPDSFDGQHPSNETESVGYFLCGLIDGMSDSEVQAKEEHLKQYFHQLKEMGAALSAKHAARIKQLLEPAKVSQLMEAAKSLASVDSIPTPELISTLEEQLEKRKMENQPYNIMLSNLLSTVVEAKDTEKALEVKSKYGDDFTFGMYMKLLGFFCSNNNLEEALKIKDEVNRKGFSELPTIVKYTDLLRLLVANGRLEDAISILKEMQERNVPVNDSTDRAFFTLLISLSAKGDVEAVNRIHEHIVMLGLAKPTAYLCSPLVMAHLVRNDYSAALDTMEECYTRYKCNPLEHEMLLRLVEAGESDLLKKAVDHLSNSIGERLMLHDLLFAFIETGKYAEAQKVVETPGLRANPRKINWFIEHCRRLNKVEVLEKCVEITKDLFENDRQEMYFQLLNLYDKNKAWSKIKPLWEKMEEEGIVPQEKTLALFKIISKKSGQEIFPVTPESHDEASEYSKKMVALCIGNKYNEAHSLLLEAEEKKLTLTKTAYTRLIKGLLEAGSVEDAIQVENITKSHFSDYTMKNISSNLLLAEQVRRDCLKDALVTVERMLTNGSMPSRVEMNKLTEALAMRGDVESLEKMEAMTASSSVALPKMDRQYFNTKLLAHFVNGHYEEACSLIESMYTNSDEHSHPISYLMLKLVNNNMSEALEKLSILVERLSNQFSVYRPVTELFLVYAQSGKDEEARSLLQRCNSILEQSGILRTHFMRQIFRRKVDSLFHLLDLIDDPFYKKSAYGMLMKHYTSAEKVNEASALYERMKTEQIEPDEESLIRLASVLTKAGKPVPFTAPVRSEQPASEEQSNTSSPPEDKQ